ncbi:hypothetical protein SPV1_12827 [Mariprofundus ferrooxydans PV-1]|uniref:Uncharacterized protein n=2 Tax=Mariprofundus ferrooxydans TaxID=314344 RepID=Q0EX16_9PROT|nr:hypothetical protein SPV1_12827 [Mariprofundus ferrooxydans PV-1]
MFNLIDLLAVEHPQKKQRGRSSQGGVKYRTICKRCNGRVLGESYDKDFKKFTDQTHKILNSLTLLALPSTLSIAVKPQRVMRAIIGHLCSVGVNRYQKGPHTEEIKSYILDPKLNLPSFINIYYWVYPYKRQILIRDAVLKDLGCEGQAYFWLMKFYPIAFFVVWDNPINYTFPNLQKLSRYRNASIDDVVELPLDLKKLPPECWPEQPTGSSIICYGNGSMGATESAKKRTIF